MNILKNRTVLGIICIAIALIICFLITPLFNASTSTLTTIVRIKEDLKIGQEITAKDIETVEVGAYNLPNEVIRKAEDIVGKYATSPITKKGNVLAMGNEYAVAMLQNLDRHNNSAVNNAVLSMLFSFGRLISDDYERKSRTRFVSERKLKDAIRRKKEALGLKDDNTVEQQY